MNPSIEYLLGFLQDEFRNDLGADHRGRTGGDAAVRIRAVQPSGLLRSIDLPQDYDPERSDLHRRTGVMVRVYGREYFFPSDWVASKKFSEISRQVGEIRDFIDASR